MSKYPNPNMELPFRQTIEMLKTIINCLPLFHTQQYVLRPITNGPQLNMFGVYKYDKHFKFQRGDILHTVKYFNLFGKPTLIRHIPGLPHV